MHSTASDGAFAPADVVAHAAKNGVRVVALTDHDTVAGVPEAVRAGDGLDVRVIAGCEFSTAAPWGEMHVLGYFLPIASAELEDFLADCRADRGRRARGMVERLRALGVEITDEDVLADAAGGAIGRPHVARALLRRGAVASVNEAFDRYLGRGRPAFVDKTLPTFAAVAALVHRVGGVVSAAHLKDRATRGVLAKFKDQGLDAIEVAHPSHDIPMRGRLAELARVLDLGMTGGSDWHGESAVGDTHGTLGSQDIPVEWLDRLERRRPTPTSA